MTAIRKRTTTRRSDGIILKAQEKGDNHEPAAIDLAKLKRRRAWERRHPEKHVYELVGRAARASSDGERQLLLDLAISAWDHAQRPRKPGRRQGSVGTFAYAMPEMLALVWSGMEARDAARQLISDGVIRAQSQRSVDSIVKNFRRYRPGSHGTFVAMVALLKRGEGVPADKIEAVFAELQATIEPAHGTSHFIRKRAR
jgi:hypothetical protein